MQAFVDLVGKIIWSIQKFYMMLLFFGFAVTVVLAITIYATAPTVADEVGDRAERLGEQAISAAREEARAQALAEDGWGYGDPGYAESVSQDSNGEPAGGWGESSD